MDVGIDPFKPLKDRSKTTSLVRVPMLGGIGPERALRLKFRYTRLGKSGKWISP